jgi:glycosyltransferase involved in cell wall biosynthesis
MGDRRLVMLQGLPREEIVAAFLDADLFLLTSAFEVAPLVLVEAMAAGVPFVSYDVGNARALAGGVVVKGPREMAAAVRDLVGDDERRGALGRAGREVQRQALDWETIVDRYEALYASLVAGKRGTVHSGDPA